MPGIPPDFGGPAPLAPASGERGGGGGGKGFRRFGPLTPTPLPRVQGRGAFPSLAKFGSGTRMPACWPVGLWCGDAIQVLVCPQEERPVGHRERRVGRFLHLVRGEQLELRARLE